MKFRIWYAVLPLAMLAGCGGDAGGAADAGAAGSDTGGGPDADASPAMPAQAVGVSGQRMTLDGAPWLSKGVALQAIVRPVAALQASGNKNTIAANANYGTTELAAIAAFDADTIRFQVSQPSLDPASSLYDASYLAQVTSAVELARRNGFVAMIMMQDERIAGETTPHPLPIAETQADWDLLNAVFGSDRGVVYELYNEPQLANTAASWQAWKDGGLLANQTTASVGMQALISHLRAEGSANVFVLDGLDFAHTLDGVPSLVDPLNRLVYAVHPYPDGSADESHWDADFGIPSQTLPVWADEWSAAPGQTIGLGDLPDYHVAVDLLNYLRLHGIPLCAGAFDIPRFMVQDVPGWSYTNYDNFSPSSTIQNAGELVHNDFLLNDGRALTAADGLSGN